MYGLTLRLLAVLSGGTSVFILWAVLLHGLWYEAIGLAAEPQTGQMPLSSPDLPVDRPVRLLLLGTSLIFRGDWPDRLAARLSDCHPAGVLVERLALPGANSAWGEEALRRRLAAGPPPNLMVVEFSINDSSLWRGLSLAKSRAEHEAILRLASGAGVTTWLATMNPALGRKAWERPGQVAYRALYRDLAQAQGGGLIATVPVWLAQDHQELSISIPDGLHPTDSAMTALMVPALAVELELVLCA